MGLNHVVRLEFSDVTMGFWDPHFGGLDPGSGPLAQTPKRGIHVVRLEFKDISPGYGPKIGVPDPLFWTPF